MVGQLAARERGRLPGRIRELSVENKKALVAEYSAGETALREIGIKFGVSLSVAKRAV